MRRPIRRRVPFASSLSQTRLPEVRPYTHQDFLDQTREDFDELMTAKNFLLDKKLDVASTMLISGHKDPRMLLRIYNNLKVEDVAKQLNN